MRVLRRYLGIKEWLYICVCNTGNSLRFMDMWAAAPAQEGGEETRSSFSALVELHIGLRKSRRYLQVNQSCLGGSYHGLTATTTSVRKKT